MGDLERLVGWVGQQIRASDLIRHLVHVEAAIGPLEDLDVDHVALGSWPLRSFSVWEKLPVGTSKIVALVP